MYAVVGCPECSSLWVLEGRPETSQCPTCGQTRAHEKRKQFVTTEDPDHAREVRASMLAARQGHDDAFAELDSFAQLEERIDEAGIDDETYLAESGVDIDEVDEAAGRTRGGLGPGAEAAKKSSWTRSASATPPRRLPSWSTPTNTVYSPKTRGARWRNSSVLDGSASQPAGIGWSSRRT